VKNAIILGLFTFTAKENKKSSPIIKFTVLLFWHCYFESSNQATVASSRLWALSWTRVHW